jgi:hypothetical protein
MTEFGPNLREYRKKHGIAMGHAMHVWDNRVQLDFTGKCHPQISFFIRWSNDWAIVHQKNARAFMGDPWWADLTRLKQDARAGGWR